MGEARREGIPPLRTGLGYDVHAFAPGRRLILGGVDIPHHQGLDGHSDADVLAHAIADALLGAATLGAIGVIALHRSVDMATLQQRFVDEGVWVRPFGRLVYAMPPYIIKDQELQTLARAMVRVVAETE